MAEDHDRVEGGHGGDDGLEEDDANGGHRRVDRRLILSGAAAGTAVLAGTGFYLTQRLTEEAPTDSVQPPRQRKAAHTPADAGGFESREQSYTAGDEFKTDAQSQKVWDTPSEAARNTEVTSSPLLATDDPVLHLLRRTTFGLTPALVDEVRSQGIDAWIQEQMDPVALADPEAELVKRVYPLASASPAQIQGAMEKGSWEAMTDYGRATLAQQSWSRRHLYEVMVDFWANHLNVPVPGAPGGWDVGPDYHNTVIRTHALGSFTDMLLAAMRHPAMLRYLGNDRSHKRSVNENLGRELLELHTVGIGGGYNETDVRNSAYILTGRSVAGENDDRGAWGEFVYDPDMHWTGPVQVLDFSHENSAAAEGLGVGDAYLRYLASHPATARTIARKLAIRLVADSPPDELVDRLAEKYLESETDIAPVLDLLLRSSEFWAAVGQKTRRPLENAVASIRALDVRPGRDPIEALKGAYRWTTLVGHRPLAWRPPNGYPDVYQPWRSASGMLETWNTHRRLTLGWNENFAYTPISELVGGLPRATVGEYVDSLCQRLCFQKFSPEHRDALIWFAGADAGTPAAEAGLENDDAPLVKLLAALVLHSPYFALR